MSASKSFTINGVIDTSKSVKSNMDTLARAAGAWVTFDNHEGKWSLVINQPGTSQHSFTDSNIIGGINISGTGLTEMYNAIELEYPHQDLQDRTDIITYSIPLANRFPNEVDNTLNVQYDCINNPVQAELLARRELKQSRVDKMIQFRTDFSKIGIKAGDIIDITSDVYGYNAKKFRILNINEEDSEDHTIQLSITAFEYSDDVYSSSGLIREYRTVENGIIGKCANEAVKGSDANSVLSNGLGPALGIVSLLNAATGAWNYFQGRGTQMSGCTAAIITWTFRSPGLDLDIRCRAISPWLGQTDITQYLGYSISSTAAWPPGNPIMIWGGDNTGVGREQVAIDIQALKSYYPNEKYYIFECRGNWYNVPNNPVNLTADLYAGGVIVPDPGNFTFNVNGYSQKLALQGLDSSVYSNLDGTGGATTLGDLIGYFVYDNVNNTAYILQDISQLGVYTP